MEGPSTNSVDPYAPPKSEVDFIPDRSPGIWCQDNLIIMRRGAQMPERCVTCNTPAPGARLRPRMYYYPWMLLPIVVILVIVFWPLAILALLIGRRSVRVEYSLCDVHLRRRGRLAAAAVLALAGSFGLLYGSWAYAPLHPFAGPLMLGAVLMFIAAFTLAAMRGRLLYLVRLRKEHVYLRGGGVTFRTGFPPFPA